MNFSRIASRVAANTNQWLWISESWEGGRIIQAADDGAAYEIAIQSRMDDSNQSREEAEEWFEKNDQLVPILNLPPLTGAE
jgi:hypothetical protein